MASFEEALINCYRMYPIFYDLSLKEYKNEKLKLNVWEKIAEELRGMGYNVQVDEAKSKMKNLRDTYGRCKKKNDAAIKPGAPASYTPTCEFWSLMTWLDDFRKRRKTMSNVSISSAPVGEEHNSSCSEAISVDESVQGNEVDGEVCFSSQSHSSSSSASVASLSPLPPSTKKKKVEMSLYQSKLIGCLEALQTTGSKKPQEQEIHDEYYYLGKSVAEQIRKLPTAFLRSKAKNEIQEIIFNLESNGNQGS